MNISDLSDKALTWTLYSAGAAAGTAISHVALRMISSSLGLYVLPVYAGFSLIGGVVYNRLVREGSSYVLNDMTSQRTVTWIFGAFGTVSTAVITTVALRVLCLTPLGWYGLALQAGIIVASGILHTQLTKEWLFSSLRGADDQKIREIVKGADKAQLLEFFKKHVLEGRESKAFAFVDQFGQRNDVLPSEVIVAAKMGGLGVGPQGTFSEVTLGKLLIYFSGSKNFSGLRFLLHHASIDPDRQIQILKTFPLGADSISLTFRNNDGEFVYPSLAPETIQYLLKSDNPTVWDLVICQKQCEDRRFEQWDAVRLEDLQPIIEFFNFNNCVDLATSQKSSYWESSLLKVVVESLSDKQVTAFFGLLLEKKSHACLPALRDTLKKRNVTAIEGFHLLPPQIIPFNYDPLYEDDTILSYRLTQQEFLASCSRRDLCSFLHRGISDTAGDHLIEEIQKQDLSSFATIEELTTVSYALFLSVTSSVRPAFEPASISADAIRWLANGDRDYFLWLLRELLHKNPTLHSTGRIPPCRSGIKGHEKERLLEERAFFWLAQAVTDTESTKAPDWVTEVVTRSPETFGFVLGQWEAFKSKDQKYRLRLLIKSLQLEEETIKRFGSAYAMEIDDRYRQLTMRQAPGREILNKIVEYGQTQSLEGNAIIETFASALVFEEQCCTVMPSEIKNNGPFVQLPRDVFEYLCHFLEPEDLARTATTCRHLFVQICGPQSRVWKHKKLGSMRAVKEMACLYYSLEMRIQIISQLATHTDEYRQGEELNTCNRFLRQALFLAWPAKRLLHLGRDVYSEGKDLVRSSLLLFGKDADGKSFIKPGKNRLAQIFDRMGYRGAHRTVIARFLRDNPVYFTYPRWAKDVVRISSEAWKLLERFGLPWSGVEPFCKGIMTCCDRAGGWNNFPENIRIRFINVLKRLQEDHPHFSFENKIPEECLVLMAL